MTSSTKKPLSGRRVLLYFMFFFAVIGIVNAVMITLAVQTHSGLVTDHPYEKGLAYNQVVAAEEAQEKLGWKGTIRYASGRLTVTLQDQTGADIIPDNMIATLTRPTQAGMDFTVPLKAGDSRVDFPAPGLWEVRVDAQVGDKKYQQSKEIVVE